MIMMVIIKEDKKYKIKSYIKRKCESRSENNRSDI